MKIALLHRLPRSAVASIKLVAAALLLAISILPQPAHAATLSSADDGATVISESWVDARTLDLTLTSPSIDTRTKKVRLLLPPGWTANATQTWPILYMLHGGLGSYVDWTDNTDIKQLTVDKNVIVAMPDTSVCSSYTNWYNYGNYGTPAWDTFINTEIQQILERGYHANSTRAVAGLSMGGLGALKFAANHQGTYAGAASYSGNVDPLHSYNNPADGPDLPAGTCKKNKWQQVWGDYTIPAQKLIWQQNDPYDQAEHLAGLNYLYISNGDGIGDPLHSSSYLANNIEKGFNLQSQAVVNKLQTLGIPVTSHFYPGSHTWPYWQQEMHASLPGLLQSLGTN